MMDNYERSRDRAQAYFLNFDQQTMIDTWHLRHDDNFLYLTFFGKSYSICRRTGMTTCSGAAAGFEETLTVFDLLCYSKERTPLSGRFAPVNSLKGTPKGACVDKDFYSSAAERFDRVPEAFSDACLALGGVPVPWGDVGFRFSMFRDLDVILKFYRADEDFPASVTLLWDENLLDFMRYETVFYAAGFLLKTIEQQMKGPTHPGLPPEKPHPCKQE